MRFGLILAVALVALSQSATAASLSDSVTYRNVCEYIADKQSEQLWGGGISDSPRFFLKDYAVFGGRFDVDGDGIPDRAMSEALGDDTDDVEFSSPENPAENAPPPAAIAAQFDSEQERYGNVGNSDGSFWLPYGSRMYNVVTTDNFGALVNQAKYYVPGQAVRYACGFSYRVEFSGWGRSSPLHRKLMSTQKYHAAIKELEDFCPREPEKDQAILSPIKPVATLTEAEDSKIAAFLGDNNYGRYHWSPSCRDLVDGCKDVWQIDFDNDGKPERLVKLLNESGNNRGSCTHQRFLLLDGENRPVSGKKQVVLDRLQDAGDRCGIGLDWVSIKGRTFLQKGPDDGLYDKTWKIFGARAIARGNEAVQMCSAYFHVKTSINYAEPADPKSH